ncbi:MAG TPA: glycine/betaine ABC transporter ATP-binding protein, partial [Thermoleophilaceae bacterium]|nr:glycine/betaine ABC transporter ATP-binding protein [Thermoleophilaceae bacterium]
VDPPLMLMDEPFGAIDPINRERLQNEFLRLQKDIRKTIVFVTHDIDEAIKMGDKIAVLQKGGKLAQFANPAELLMNPASKFVEEFVGADRALKRLALQRVKDIDLWKVAQVRVGEMSADARRKVEDADLKSHVLVVDDRGRPHGWLAVNELGSERVPDGAHPGGEVEMDDILRDALADLLTAEARYGAVVDGKGVVQGALSIEVISRFLHEAPTDSRSGADLVEDPAA